MRFCEKDDLGRGEMEGVGRHVVWCLAGGRPLTVRTLLGSDLGQPGLERRRELREGLIEVVREQSMVTHDLEKVGGAAPGRYSHPR